MSYNLIKSLIINMTTLYLLLAMYGCQSDVKKSTCPENPVFALDSSKLKEVVLSPKDTTQSSMISGNESIGYKFSGIKGQKFNYQVSNSNICVWLYSPDNQSLSSNVLPRDGQYIVQIQNIQGAGTFDIVMSLGNENNIAASPTATIFTSPSPTSTPSVPVIKTSSNSDRPRNSPENLIAQYYQEINSRDYQSAWNKLPITLQNNLNVHPEGYKSFVDFFDRFDRIRVNYLGVVDETESSAEVKADLTCMRNGNTAPLFLRFYLKKDEAYRSWKIDKVKLDPHRISRCG
jgi:hypothetical protein